MRFAGDTVPRVIGVRRASPPVQVAHAGELVGVSAALCIFGQVTHAYAERSRRSAYRSGSFTTAISDA